ncbi:dicarboxylate/amino acid:cation symporter [bacterium SCSIO 12696]|nr:dicarboxylate/amino acid:cation symporter [bacterium SCSIO 12696]
MTLTTRILIGMLAGMLVGGVINGATGAGWIANANEFFLVDLVFDPVGAIFIACLKMAVIPVVFFSLTCGSAAMGANARMGRLAGGTLGLYLITTAMAVAIALLIANIIDPGIGVPREGFDAFEPKNAPGLKDVIVGMFPTNPVQAMAEGKMLQIIMFCILLGIALSMAGDAGNRVLVVFQDVNEVVLKMITLILHLAPYGVFALLAKQFSLFGWSEFVKVGLYMVAVAVALVVHFCVTYPGLLKLFTGLNPLTFVKNVRPAMITAFSTSSSAATMPVTMSVVKRRLGVDNRVASFTIPLGATINMDGTAIMQGVATVFIAQVYGVELSFVAYLTVIVTATLASVGTAAVPSAGLIMLAIVLQQLELPAEAIGMILGVDRLLDMMRTCVNIGGDCAVSTIVAKRNDMLDETVFNDLSDGDDHRVRPNTPSGQLDTRE